MPRPRQHRRSIRLRGYDYTRAGAYFVTICAHERACLFGEIVGGVMLPNDAGSLVLATWDAIPAHHPGIDVDEFVVMPNHVHGIIVIESFAAPATDPAVGAPLGVAHTYVPGGAMNRAPTFGPGGTLDRAPAFGSGGAMNRAPTVDHGPTLGGVIRAFKARVTRALAAPVWQRNYYEHIIRDEESLRRIRRYIRENPARWALDRENPAAAGVRRRIGPDRDTPE